MRKEYKHEIQDLLEIEDSDLSLKFNNLKEEEIYMKRLEKAMNLIIINNFHTNVNINNFFKNDEHIL